MTDGTARRSAISPLRAEDFAGWYQEVVRSAELATMAHVRGCMVIRPWGYGIWELMQRRLDDEIGRRGHENVYFPILIPLSYFRKEAEHVEGFAKEMAVVTHHRLESVDGNLVPAGELHEPVVVRPTSETIFGESMADWIRSYRDLPLKLNQWANVVRWEMRPRVFLRTSEFLWQEGHTAHADEAEALEQTIEMHTMYREFSENWLAVPVIPGEKSPSERFPGAERTFTIEAMMQDGRALQAGTSHYLGQNFARAANIDFVDADGAQRLAHTTSFGASTRLVGSLIMSHGDDDGLCLPPAVAPHQIVVIPLLRGHDSDSVVTAYARRVAGAIGAVGPWRGAPLRVHLDERAHRPVEKKWHWIKRGAPVLIEVGPRDEHAEAVSLRIRLAPHDLRQTSLNRFLDSVHDELDGVQDGLLARARERTTRMTRTDITTRDEIEAFFTDDRGFVVTPWCESPRCEVALKHLGVTVRCLPSELRPDSGPCGICGRPATVSALWGMSY